MVRIMNSLLWNWLLIQCVRIIVMRSHLGLLKDILQFCPLDFVIYYSDSIIQNY
jgi:hypothetical protein